MLLALIVTACSGEDPAFIRVEQGAFRSTITETGELQAVKYMTVTMPPFRGDYGQPKVTDLAKEGILVKKGDVIGQIETAGVTRTIGQQRAELEIARADMAKMRVEHQTQIKQAEAEIRSAEAQLRVEQIGMQQVKFESPAKQEIAGLKLQIAETGLRKARQKAEAVKRTQAEEVRIQQAKIKQIEAAIETAELTLNRFTLRAPADGMVEYRRNRRTRTKVAVGDQLWQGWPILGLPDMSKMKVETTVNEADIGKAQLGQRVRVRLDAFPKAVFEGAVTRINRVSRRLDRDNPIKVFDIEVVLDDADPILRPGMTVSCEFEVAEIVDALFVDPAGVHQEESEYVVYVEDGGGLRRVPVTLGPRNAHAVVVQGPLRAGDRIARTPPAGDA